MSAIELRQITKAFGAAKVIHGVDLAIESGEFCVFVGPSGCGKSTLLRMIAGLEDVTSGDLLINDRIVNNVAPSERGLAMVFQSYALYPHMTVAGNMSFGLRMTGMPKTETERRVREAAAILQLEPLLGRKPSQLSGGQRQRVAIGRAIVRQPTAFLFDEPLSNLDAELRVQMRIEIAKLHQQLGSTMIYVTHDQVEAMTLADKIVVLRAGAVEQIGRPVDLYRDPDNLFVAGFIGSPKMNMLPATIQADNSAAVASTTARLRLTTMPPPGANVTLGIRPESLGIGDDAGDVVFQLDVSVVENLGGESIVHGRLADGTVIRFAQRGDHRSRVGEVLSLRCRADDILVFDADGRRLR